LVHRHLSRLVIAALILAQLLCVQPARAAFNGQITGTVTDATTKAPLGGVHVVANSSSGTYRATTDAHGRFTIVGVVPDTYTVGFDAPGYLHGAYPGVTVLADSAQHIEMTLSKGIRTIASVHSRAASSAFQPGQTEDSYALNSSAIEQVQGHAFNQDEQSLLKSLPSVTIDRTGTVDIRGGLSYQTAYQYEGIDYTEPNKNLQNSFANVSNFNLLNGIGQVQIVPGGGDATHGDTGTGLVSIRAKRGTYPSFSSFDFEVDTYPFYNQLAGEYGTATKDGRFSEYIAYTGIGQRFQYGSIATPGALIGIYQGNSQIGVYENAADQTSNDIVNNFFYKFGKDQDQQLQLFLQYQRVVEGLGYNGIQDICYASCSGLFAPASIPPASGTEFTSDYGPNVIPLFPGQKTADELVPAEDTITSPFNAEKLEYSRTFNSSTFAVLRVYRTSDSQQETEPASGIFIPDSGGIRTGTSGEFTKQLNENNLLELGGKFEFTHPYGTFQDYADYNYAFFDYPLSIAEGNGSTGGLAKIVPPNFMALDFVPESKCGTSGLYPVLAQSYPALAGGNGFFPCGYLSKYFPGGMPRLPEEEDSPVANQQVYGWFVQDTATTRKLKSQLGLRLDGFNFQFASDPTNPPTIAAVAHQRLFEPHIGETYTIGSHDFIRATFGRTLAIPLPGLFGNNIDRSAFSAFNAVPSYDNSTNAPATYCGLNEATLCANYADQLYWVYRDAKFGAAQLAQPLRGSTFTNWDFTYSHEFRNGSSFSVTPFFRRGYDIVENSTSIIGFSNTTGLPLLAPYSYSNLGMQKATGVELLFTKELSRYWSGYVSATYINQLGNDPAGLYLPTASLALGNVYRSDLVSPFQATTAATYKIGPWRLNGVINYNKGYPFGQGTYTQVFINGVAYNIPNTNLAQVLGVGAGIPSAYYVDPQNPGTRINPIIIGNSGLTGSTSAGSLLSRANADVNLTIEFNAPNSPLTLGMVVYNLFDQRYGIPLNNPRYLYPVATGAYGPGTGTLPVTAQNTSQPALFSSTAFPNSPYLIFPNQQPITFRFYTQVKV
jgi:hypothetical protein